MRKLWIAGLVAGAAFALCGCGGARVRPSPDGIVRIMPLGDSITQGRPAHPSYRPFLWKQLSAAGYKVDLVGSVRGSYEPGGKEDDGDPDHEGHWALGTREVLAELPRWLEAARPQVVLLHLGTRNIARGEPPEQIAGEIARIIVEIRNRNPEARILLAQIIPISEVNLCRKSTALNAKLQELARKMTTRQSPILLVDQAGGFVPNLHTYDGVHPNEEGARRMADRWFATLAPILPH